MTKTLKVISLAIIVFLILLIGWMNLTSGYFQRAGCCGVKYVTNANIGEPLIMGCPLVICTLTPLDNLKLLLSELDFYK